MKRNSVRRWLSLLLTAALLTALLPAAVFAASGGGCERGLDHQWGEWATTKQPTCTEEGMRKRTCSRCGKTETGSVPAKGHRFGEWTVVSEPTDRAPGMKEHTCGVCGWVAQVYTDPEGTLRIGDRGATVKELQDALKIAGYDTGSELSLYGDKTEAAVTAFERDHGFTPDGIAWPAVIGAIKLVSADPVGTTVGAVTKDGISVQPDGSLEDADGGQEEEPDGQGGGEEKYAGIQITAMLKNPVEAYKKGQTIEVNVCVTNTGTTYLKGSAGYIGVGTVIVYDDLAPQEKTETVVTHEVTDEDIKSVNGQVYFKFNCVGFANETGESVGDSTELYILTDPEPVAPAIQLSVKLHESVKAYGRYEDVPLDIHVENIGDCDLKNVTVSLVGGPMHILLSLPKGEGKDLNDTYNITFADSYKPSVILYYTAEGVSEDGQPATASDQVTVAVAYKGTTEYTNHGVTIVKSASQPQNGKYYQMNETVKYIVEVMNNGQSDVTIVRVRDVMPDQSIEVLDPGGYTLAHGETCSYTTQYTVRYTDLKKGSFTNTASVDFLDEQNTARIAKVRLTLDTWMEGLGCWKTVTSEPKNGQFYTEGEVITFRVVLVNKVQTEKVNDKKYKITHTYTDIKGYDILYEGNGHCFDSIPLLKPKNKKIFNVTHTVTAFEAWQGANMGTELVNFAWFELTDENGAPVMAWSNPVSVPVGIDPPEEKTEEKTETVQPAPASGNACCRRVTETAFDGTTAYTLAFCDKHAEVLERAEELLAGDDTAAAVSAWREAADALYTDWKAAAGQEAEAVIDRDRDAFFGELDALAALEESAGADSVTDDMLILLENKCVDLCHALTCGQDDPDGCLAPYDPEQEILEGEACGAERFCDGTETEIESTLCGELCNTYTSIMRLAAETETPGQLAGAYETGSAYCNTERNRLYAELFTVLPETVMAECTAAAGWTAAEADALALLYPEHPELAAELRLRDELTHLQMLCALTDAQSEE